MNPPPRGLDRFRQVTVLIGAVLAVLGAAAGSGAFGGTSIGDAADGWFDSDATLVAPAGTAFSIWSVIYALLVAFAVYQVLPRQAANPRLRASAWWILSSMVLNAVWIALVQAELLGLSIATIAALVAVLVLALVPLVRVPPANAVEGVLTDGTVGVYLGWVSVATVANVATVLGAWGVRGWGLDPTVWAVVLLVVVAALAVGLAVYTAPRPFAAFGIGLAMAWGLAWIGVGRMSGDDANTAVAITAFVAAAIALAAPAVTTRRASTARD